MVNNPEKTTLVVNLLGLSGTGKTSTANLMAHIYSNWHDLSATVFHPSDLLRTYGEEHGIALDTRADYESVHRMMEAEDPEFMTKRIESLAPNYNVLILDGLRKYSHAKALQETFSKDTSTVEYRTSQLIAPDRVRFDRIQADVERGKRPESVPKSLKLFIESEMHDIKSPYYEMPKVWAMRDAPETAIDTQGKTTLQVAKIIMAAVRLDSPSSLSSA